MEAQEEVLGSNDHTHTVKGKRTKRQRLSSPPLSINAATSSSSAGGSGGGGGGGDGDVDGEDEHNIPSPTTSAEFTDSTEEEEDMANCLILLAQGHNLDNPKRIEESDGMERLGSHGFVEAATTTTTTTAITAAGKAGLYVYECKTCNKCFPSFQALGGHRASHRRPKPAIEEKKVLDKGERQFNNHSSHLNLQLGDRGLYRKRSKVHGCSVCGSEFASGQALGGHMRRHRTPTGANTSMTITSEPQEPEKPRNMLSLDLNLPAPEDDHREPKFSFTSKQQPLMFSTSALVGCHY